jgi:hypothetical protein
MRPSSSARQYFVGTVSVRIPVSVCAFIITLSVFHPLIRISSFSAERLFEVAGSLFAGIVNIVKTQPLCQRDNSGGSPGRVGSFPNPARLLRENTRLWFRIE